MHAEDLSNRDLSAEEEGGPRVLIAPEFRFQSSTLVAAKVRSSGEDELPLSVDPGNFI